jgi:hypothetical protein
MNKTDYNKLIQIRKLLKEAYDHYFQHSDGHCKSVEGNISLEFGDYWSDKECECKITGVSIYSYVLGSSRNHYFDTLDEALETVKKWHNEEMSTDYKEQDRLEEEYYKRHYPNGYLINPDLKIDKDYWGGPKIG